MRINHNIPALRTLHQMNKTNNKIDKTMQKLSSGLRINSASDDAAGLAIAQKMSTQVRGLQQANRNSMDGISLIQTAEGALNEVHSMLQRTRELAIQASNGTLTPSDRKAITDEVTQLKAEINRISDHIEYNERKLLNGEIDRRKFSNKDTAGKVISMTDTVKAGDYTLNIKSPATQTTLVGDIPKDILYNTSTGKVAKDGMININGEQVEIKAGDTEQDVFSKVRNLCDTVGLDISVSGGGTYVKGSKLILVSREYGEKNIVVKGDVSLLEGLGLDGIRDAKPTTITGGNPIPDDLYDTATPKKVKLPSGDFTINGETVSIKENMTEEDVFNAIEAICDKQGIDLLVEGGGEYKATSKLIMNHRENGAKPVQIKATAAVGKAILKNLGLSVETETPTIVTGDLPRIDIYDEDGKTLVEGDFMAKITAEDGTVVNIPISITKDVAKDDVFDAIKNTLIADDNIISVTSEPGPEGVGSRLVIKGEDGKATQIEFVSSGISGDTILAGLGLTDPVVKLGTDENTLNGDTGILRGMTQGKNVKIKDMDLQGFPEGRTYQVNGNIITFEANGGFKLGIEAAKAKKDLKTGDFEAGAGIVAEALRGKVTFTLLETGPLDLQIGANEGQMMQLRIQNMSTAALGLDHMNLNTADKSQEAITLVDAAIAQVSSARSKLGAYQNRLEHTVANLDVAAENMTASMSRIQDADMAKEMADYTKDNILAQAGNAMLAQANQRPQQILQLLQ